MAHRSLRASFVITTVATFYLAACGDDCPSTVPGAYASCESEGQQCSLDADCQGGPVTVNVVCAAGYWELTPQPCSKPADSCPGTSLYCSENVWTKASGTNPPAPCPDTLPDEGSSCSSSGLGGVHEYCGYPCASTGQWVVARCPYVETGQSSWTHDQACP